MTHIDIITALKLIRQATNTEVREVLDQAIAEIKRLRSLSNAGLEVAMIVAASNATELPADLHILCQAIIEEAQQ